MIVPPSVEPNRPQLITSNPPPPKTLEPRILLPPAFIRVIAAICLLPLCLNLVGIDFDANLPTNSSELWQAPVSRDVLFGLLRGDFVHTLLEAIACCIAFLTAMLAFIHFRLRQDVITPVIGVVLLCVGVMDAVHILAADHLIKAVATSQEFVPFTAVISRLTNVLLTLLGVSVFLFLKRKRKHPNIYWVLGISTIFCGLSYLTIYLAATSPNLPQTTYSNSLLARPWDLLPLVLFLVSGLLIYPRFYRAYPSVFTHSLIISTIPNVLIQAYLLLGSKTIFDNSFNIAHFLKIVAYVVPLTGLIYDYYLTYKKIDFFNTNLQFKVIEQEETALFLCDAQEELIGKNQELENTLTHLKETQLQLIQTEKMSSLGQMVAGIAHEINNPMNFIHGNIHHLRESFQELLVLVDLYDQELAKKTEAIATTEQLEIDLEFLKMDIPKIFDSMDLGTARIQDLILSLRNFSRLDEAETKIVDLTDGLENTLIILNSRLKHNITIQKNYHSLPAIQCHPAQLNQVWMNLISNAIDAMEETAITQPNYQPKLTLTTKVNEQKYVCVSVSDNGPGIDDLTQRKIFDPFFTTKPIGKGTGLGLAIAYQIIEKHGGYIKIKSSPEGGTTFNVILPINNGQ